MDTNKRKAEDSFTSCIKIKQACNSVLRTDTTRASFFTDPSAHSENVIKRRRLVQDFLLIWLDSSMDELNEDHCTSITQLRRIVNTINIFHDADQCIDFLTELEEEKAFMIVSCAFRQHIVPLIHDFPQLNTIFVFDEDTSSDEHWTTEGSKVKGIFSQIDPLCESLKQAAWQFEQGSSPISFISNDVTFSQNLDELDQSFMWTQILKEILMEIEYDEHSIEDLITYYRDKYAQNEHELSIIARFQREYHLQSPIWWYTRENFLYSVLNRALRTQETDILIKMGFFVRDLHQHIQVLHAEQFGNRQVQPFTVYRGQGMSKRAFEAMIKANGGLISFNSFLSTSKDQHVAFALADSNQGNPDVIGILFEMMVDPSISSVPIAYLDSISYFASEQEVLFSMHTVFRVGDVTRIGSNDRLWNVKLTLTSDQDPHLCALTRRMRAETFSVSKGWPRLAALLVKLGAFDKAEQVYRELLDQTFDDNEKAFLYNQLGCIRDNQADYAAAISFHEKGLEIEQKILPSNRLHLAISYSNIGRVYKNIGDYSKAVSFYEKAFDIRAKDLPPYHPDLAVSYNNIGAVYKDMGDHSKALSFYEKALEISQKSLPAYHPSLVASYNNMAAVYDDMGDYSKAISLLEKTLEIDHKSLPSDHRNSAFSLNNMGAVYSDMGDYSKALSFHERAHEIRQKSLPTDHPDLAISYNNIGHVYQSMGVYSKALSFFEKALEIGQKNLPPDHLHLATFYSNIAGVYDDIGDYSKALSFYESIHEVRQKILPAGHPDLAGSYNDIGFVYQNMGVYSKALSFFEKALEIGKSNLFPDHPDLASSYSNIGGIYRSMGDYTAALSFNEKALNIRKKILPPNHPDLAYSYNSIGAVHLNMKKYSTALSFFEKALDIFQEALPANHSELATFYNNIGLTYNNMGEYSRALSFYEKTLKIYETAYTSDHPNMAFPYTNIGLMYNNMGERSKALLSLGKALEIRENTLSPNHPDLAQSYNHIGVVYEDMNDYSKSLSLYERAVEIGQQSLLPNHPHLQLYRKNLENVKTLLL